MKPRLLDLFCGAGGAGKGYADAGFEVIGVDIEPQPNYPFEFHQFDALEPRRPHWMANEFDAVHASPPCPLHSSLNGWSGETESPDLIPQTRKLLQATWLPYVIENVVGAPLINPTRICGQGLGLKVRRHRLFEANFSMMGVPCHHHEPPVIVVGGSIGRKVFDPQRKAIAPSFDEARDVMGVPWMQTRQEVVNAIPPAYTEHIGGYLMVEIQRRTCPTCRGQGVVQASHPDEFGNIESDDCPDCLVAA